MKRAGSGSQFIRVEWKEKLWCWGMSEVKNCLMFCKIDCSKFHNFLDGEILECWRLYHEKKKRGVSDVVLENIKEAQLKAIEEWREVNECRAECGKDSADAVQLRVLRNYFIV
jgi:hypothetical protein